MNAYLVANVAVRVRSGLILQVAIWGIIDAMILINWKHVRNAAAPAFLKFAENAKTRESLRTDHDKILSVR